MAIEVEKKYRLTRQQYDLLLHRLPVLGAISEGQDFEENTLFRGGRLELGSSVLRLRRLKNSAVLTFKERLPSSSEIKHQREDETWVGDPDSMATILDALGFTPALVYEKRRQTWYLDNTQVAVDELPFGLFMEIEGDEDAILAVEDRLEIEGLKSEPATYPQLAFKHGVKNGELVESRFLDQRV